MSTHGADGTPRDAGYDDWLDGIASGEGVYLACEQDHGSLPPRRACPHCGSPDLAERPLPDSGEIETVTVVHVAAPSHADDTPYATAIADFGPVRLTGMVRGVAPADAEIGLVVEPTVERTETRDERVLVFRPR
jgi:hypothetical protein